MIQHEKTLLSENLLEKEFVCNLTSCKGACCIEGEYGAPLTESEIEQISDELPKIKPFMTEEGKALLKRNGFFEEDPDKDLVTTCLPDGACVFAIEEQGIHKCSIEKAFNAGKTQFRKPVSCHLYPVRLKEMGEYTAVNVDNWHICHSACKLGEAYQIPVYKFLQEALVRRFGRSWYQELELIAEEYKKVNDSNN